MAFGFFEPSKGETPQSIRRQRRVAALAARVGGRTPPQYRRGHRAGRSSKSGAVSADELQRALGGRLGAAAAMPDFMRRRFADAANKNTFLRKNTELLDRFPALKQEMIESAGTGAVARRVASTAQTRQGVLTGSPGEAFATAPVQREFQAILNSTDPAASARSLVRQAANDETGQAVRGLKAAALDHLIGKASRDGGLSGKAIGGAMNDPKTRGALAEILTPAEMRRLGRITGELDKTAMAYRRPPKVKAQRALKNRAA